MTAGAGPAPGPTTAPKLSAGVLTADLTRLGAELEILRGAASWAHVDVMDGTFCPQLTVGPAFIAAAASTGIPVGKDPAGNLSRLLEQLHPTPASSPPNPEMSAPLNPVAS
jgi:hypothetical protein